MWKNKKFNMIISLLIAIALWAFVIGTMDPVTTKNFQDVPVSFTHIEELSDQGLAIADSTVKKINVTAQGKKSVLNETDSSDVRAVIDAKDLKLGTNKCRIKITISGKATVKNQSTTVAYVTVENITSSERNIVVSFSNAEETKEEPTLISQSQSTVSVKATTSVLSRVDHVKAVIPASEVSKSVASLNAALVAVDKNGNKVENVVLSTPMIKVEAVLYKTKTVALKVQVRGLGDKKAEKPESVTVKGPSDLLDSISTITADEINAASISKATSIKLNLHLPDGVFVASSSKPMVVKIIPTDTGNKPVEPEEEQGQEDSGDKVEE